jgi:hypothetical protein
VAIPNKAVLPWDYDDRIVLFAAQYLSGPLDDAITRLAHSLHSGINILILYYLETRREVYQPLPNWMYLYGIIYTESGFRIYAHYPLYQPELDTRNGVGGWFARSKSIEFDVGDVFNERAHKRASAIAALLRIQSHIRFVLNRLKQWDGFNRATQYFDAIE